MAPAPHGERFRELDVFRGVAALAVVLFHFVLRYQIDHGAGAPAPDWVAAIWRAVRGVSALDGLLPVFWFFMISGFVIVWTLERCRTWRDFAVSRVSRLYPAYWAAALATFAVGSLAPLPGQAYTAGQLAANLTMLHELVGVAALDGAYWSLFVELVFYVMMGSLFALGRMGWLVPLCGLWALACLANALLPQVGIEIPWQVQRFALLRHGHFFAAGAMFFQLWQGRSRTGALAVILLCLAVPALAYRPADALICAGFFASFALAIAGWLRRIAVAPLLWLGAISYPLYVCHQMVGMRLLMALEAAGIGRAAAVAAAVAAVLALAHGIHVLVERPALAAIRGHWRARRAAA